MSTTATHNTEAVHLKVDFCIWYAEQRSSDLLVLQHVIFAWHPGLLPWIDLRIIRWHCFPLTVFDALHFGWIVVLWSFGETAVIGGYPTTNDLPACTTPQALRLSSFLSSKIVVCMCIMIYVMLLSIVGTEVSIGRALSLVEAWSRHFQQLMRLSIVLISILKIF